MRVFEELCPRGPEWTVRWDELRSAFWWLRRLEGVEQDVVHHAEGDVATHTRMAATALASLPEWQALPAERRVRLFAAVLLHDVAKPDCTQHQPDGSITAHGHSRRGELRARRILWELDSPVAFREHVAALVRHHQVPFWTLERPDLEEIALRVSTVASNLDLTLLATADILGRICADLDTVLATIQLFREFCDELGILDSPWPFANDHARFGYFCTPGRDPRWAAYDDTTFTVTVLSGLPGAGKDHYAASSDLPVVSLDALRSSLGVKPTDSQGPVLAAARSAARILLRSREPFVWNATNITRQQRSAVIDLAAGYGARISIVAIEAPPAVISARNSARPSPVPAAAVERMIARWEAPDLTEAHAVTWLDTRAASAGS